MATVQERLGKLTNRQTLWELVATNGAEVYLVRYTNRRSRSSLFESARHSGQQLARLTGSDRLTFYARSGDGAYMGAWAIKWSGRTQRDAIREGEHAYIGDYPI